MRPLRRNIANAGREVGAVLPAFLTARIVVVVAHLLAAIVAEELSMDRRLPLDDGAVAWDGRFYETIADDGYGALDAEARRFFPLFPLLGRVLGAPFGGGARVPLVVVANLAALGFLVLLRRLVTRECGARHARRAVWLVALWPAAFVLSWGYAEPLALAATAACLLWLREGKFSRAAAAAFVAALTRPFGVLLVVPALIEVARRRSQVGRADLATRAAAVMAAPAGLAVWLAWCAAEFGDWLAPIREQSPLRGDVVDPLSRLWRAASDLAGSERMGDGLHFPFAIALVVGVILATRRLPASLSVYAAAVVVLSLSAENLNSLERYGLSAFPALVALALVVPDREWERAAVVCSGAAMGGLCLLALVGAYVP